MVDEGKRHAPVAMRSSFFVNDPSSATAAKRRGDCNHDGPPPFAAAHSLGVFLAGIPMIVIGIMLFSRLALCRNE